MRCQCFRGNPLKYILLRERKRERVQSCFFLLSYLFIIYNNREEEDVQRVFLKKRRRQLQMARNLKPFPLSRSETGISSKHMQLNSFQLLPSEFFYIFFSIFFFRTLRVPTQGSECRYLKSRNHYPLGRRVLLRRLVLA